jgi:hypothetical protein
MLKKTHGTVEYVSREGTSPLQWEWHVILQKMRSGKTFLRIQDNSSATRQSEWGCNKRRWFKGGTNKSPYFDFDSNPGLVVWLLSTRKKY